MYKKYYASVNGFLFDHTVAVEGYFDYNPLSDSTHYMTWKLFAAYLWDPATIGIEYVQQPAVAPVSGVATDQGPNRTFDLGTWKDHRQHTRLFCSL